MKHGTKILTAAVLAASLTGCHHMNTSAELSPTANKHFSNVVELNHQVSRFESDSVYAPDSFAKVQDLLGQARWAANENDKSADKLSKDGLKQLQIAINTANQNKETLHDLHQLREKAIKANARKIFGSEFAKIDNEIAKTYRLVESGKFEQAKKLEAQQIAKLEKVMFNISKNDLTRSAKSKLEEATSFRAASLAPKTYAKAKDEYNLSILTLKNNPDDKEVANLHASNALYFANKSKNLANTIESHNTRSHTLEDIILEHQSQLNTLHAKLTGEEIDFDIPSHRVVAILDSKISALQDAEQSQSLTAKNLQDNVQNLEKRFSSNEDRFEKVAKLFGSSEAEVIRQGKDVVIRLYGLNYTIGSSEIDSSNYPLLEKALSSIQLYDNPKITVVGHADATGNNDVNKIVSNDRAVTLSKFITNVGKLDSAKVQAYGAGKTKPIASNETDEGRRLNRRVEIILNNVVV